MTLWTFTEKKTHTKKNTVFERKKKKALEHIIEFSPKSWMNYLWTFTNFYRRKKNTVCIFFSSVFGKKYTILGFDWLNGHRTFSGKKKYGTFAQVFKKEIPVKFIRTKKKSLWNYASKIHPRTVKLGTIFFKTVSSIVILKIVGSTPQLDIKFWIP